MPSSLAMWSESGAPLASAGNSSENCPMKSWFRHFGENLSTQL
jgi:hypothetical protein